MMVRLLDLRVYFRDRNLVQLGARTVSFANPKLRLLLRIMSWQS